MKRDIRKVIAEGEALADQNERFDLDAVEMKQIREQAATDDINETLYNAIELAYYAGLAIGNRNGGKRA